MKEKYILPKGFLTSGIKAKIKLNNKYDVGLIYSEKPCINAIFFTKNKLKCAHIQYDKKLLKNNIRVIFANSGCANALTGKQGIYDIEKIVKVLSEKLKIPKDSILFTSTGKIGKRLPVKNIINNISNLIKNLKTNDKKFPYSILTTDLKTKFVTEEFWIYGKKCRITGIAKGSGMISPNMATMLAYILTDANINKKLLKKAAKEAIDFSFNKITVDGDMSPNDTVIFLSNGMAENKIIDKEDKEFLKFKNILKNICYRLSEKIVEDGEGVTKVIKIIIKNAKTKKQAEKIARSIANSLLVKTAFFGESFNPGRIISAAGATLQDINIEKIILKLNNIKIVSNGRIVVKSIKKAEKILKKPKILLELDLKYGKFTETLLTSDLSYNYIKINAAYT